MKKEVCRFCDVEFIGDEKHKPFVDEAVCKFLEYIDTYYRLGFVRAIKVDVHFKEKIRGVKVE